MDLGKTDIKRLTNEEKRNACAIVFVQNAVAKAI